jgi:hypothetical protein
VVFAESGPSAEESVGVVLHGIRDTAERIVRDGWRRFFGSYWKPCDFSVEMAVVPLSPSPGVVGIGDPKTSLGEGVTSSMTGIPTTLGTPSPLSCSRRIRSTPVAAAVSRVPRIVPQS